MVIVMDYSAIFAERVVSPAVVQHALRVLRAIADGESDIRAVRHPLGFLCLPIERHDVCGICVHLWSPRLTRTRPTTSGMHAHSWDLLSLLLAGELRNDLVTVVDERPTHRVFEVHSRGAIDEMRATPRLVSSLTDRTEAHRAGGSYAVGAGQFHATFATEAVTVAVGRGRPGAVDLSLGAIDAGTHHVRRHGCDGAETALAAREAVRQL
jgi:hypothetical protein